MTPTWEQGRDYDTFRPISAPPISPPMEMDEANDGSALPSRWCVLPVMVCALVATLLVGWAYAGEHPDVLNGAPVFMQKLAARSEPPPPVGPPMRAAAAKPPASAATAASTPPAAAAAAPAVAAAPAPAAAAAPQPEQSGFVSLTGPKGAKVFDGDKLLGTAPLVQAATAGAHTIRVQAAGSSKSQSVDIDVKPAETTPIVVDARKLRKRSRRASL